MQCVWWWTVWVLCAGVVGAARVSQPPPNHCGADDAGHAGRWLCEAATTAAYINEPLHCLYAPYHWCVKCGGGRKRRVVMWGLRVKQWTFCARSLRKSGFLSPQLYQRCFLCDIVGR